MRSRNESLKFVLLSSILNTARRPLVQPRDPPPVLRPLLPACRADPLGGAHRCWGLGVRGHGCKYVLADAGWVARGVLSSLFGPKGRTGGCRFPERSVDTGPSPSAPTLPRGHNHGRKPPETPALVPALL